MVNHFSASARRAVRDATDEARRRGDRRVGTDHLVLGLLHDPQAADLLGVDLGIARAALDALDRRAMASVGVEVPDVLRSPVAAAGRLPFTAGAGDALRRTLRDAQLSKSRLLEIRHLLLALLDRPRPDPAADLLAAMAIDPDTVRRRLNEAA
jgi:ATP-dependent Clp protease ATP-binding subunit ClpA